MDGLSAAASVIAVIQIADQVLSLISDYIKRVKNAEQDIIRLQRELTELRIVLEDAQKLLDSTQTGILETSHKLNRTLSECSSQLKDLVSKLEYKSTKSNKKFSFSKFIRNLKWPFESKDVDNIIQNLQKFRDVFSTGLEIDQTRILINHLEHVEFDERYRILDWISSVPHGKHHITVAEARTNNTCEWLLRHERFHEWESSESPVFLWLYGSPGAGKTFITSKVIDHISGLSKDSQNQGFAYFYCNRNEAERREPVSILQSYVRQLSAPMGDSQKMRKKLRDLYRSMVLKGSQLSFDTCREQLLEAVNLYDGTTIILDALDECDPNSRGRLVDIFEFLLTNSKKPIRIFFSSRPDRDIRKKFFNTPNIEIEAKHNEINIQNFVNNEITKHGSWGDMSSSLQKEIVKTLQERSDGMFQWVNLQIKQLLELESEEAIRNRLGKLPKDLETAYNEIYDRIQSRDQNDKLLADRAFKWVMCACEPLNSEQLLSAICWNPENEGYLASRISESQLLHLCNHLLVLDSHRKVWRFPHLSVTEYFETNHWTLLQAHCNVAKVCLGLLIKTYEKRNIYDADNLNYEDEGNDEDDYGDKFTCDTLFKYSCVFWVNHVQNIQGEQEADADIYLAKLLKDFLGSPMQSSVQYQRWCRDISTLYGLPSSSSLRCINSLTLTPEDCCIFLMCRFSFYVLLQDWWENADIPLSQVNGVEENLILAVLGGCIPICEELINRGICINSQDNSKYCSALAAAATTDIKIVEYLVEKGADMNIQLQNGYYGSSLAAAAAESEIEIVQYLVEKGANMNMQLQSGVYGSALAAAATSKIKDVQYLIEKGADVNMQLQNGRYGSALAAAVGAIIPNINIIHYLIEKGADVNLLLHTGDFGSALAAAAYWGRKSLAEILINAGAEVNLRLRNGHYATALQVAQGNVPPQLLENDWRNEKEIERDRAEVAEILQRYSE